MRLVSAGHLRAIVRLSTCKTPGRFLLFLVYAGVEVGVDRGGYSAHMLRNWHGDMLHLVDPWMAAGAYPAFREDALEVV